jgi:dipeptidyl aminopeptidase/acylaminoacyl peptidase
MTRRSTLRAFAAALAVSIVVIAPGGAQSPSSAPAFTIEQVMSAAFPSEIAAAPSGGTVAWIQNAEGVRNVWIAERPDYKGRALTSYDRDDGQALTDLTWMPDGRSLVYVRGAAANRAGDLPNPALLIDGGGQALWLVDVASGTSRKLADGAAPAVPSTGDLVAYLVRGQVWAVGTRADAEPARLFVTRGQASALRWSPDGSRLAFVSGRGDHAFVGVFDRASGTTMFLDPSVDRDAAPAWSPDGRRVAFVRERSERSWPFHPARSGEPWSIQVAEALTGVGRTVFQARPGKGSMFHALDGPHQLFWLGPDTLAFPWERDGWTHLYAVSVGTAGEPRALTSGGFEVEQAAPTADGRSLIVSTNQEDIDRRHLWRVGLDGPARRLTEGSFIEWAPAPLADGRGIAFLRAGATEPAHPAILVEGGQARALARSWPARFPLDKLVEPTAVAVTAADGLAVRAQLFLPRTEGQAARHPAVIFLHGGSRRQMLLGWHYRDYYHHTYAFNQYLAARGFVVLSLNYRSGIGYGLEFREAERYGATGASEFQDVVGAGLFLKAMPRVDPARIGLWGGSYGGYLTAMGLARASDLFAAGVDIHGVHDWNVAMANFAPDYDPALYPDTRRLAFDSSPMASLDSWRSPVLVVHGDDDRNVPFSETVDLVQALRKRGVEVEQLVFPDEVHGFLLHRNWLAAFEAGAEFLERRLGRRPATSP